MIKDIVMLFNNRGYKYIGCNQPGIAIFFKPINAESTAVCIIADFTAKTVYTPDHLSSIANEVERKLIFNRYAHVFTHYILLSNNISRDKSFNDSGLSFWIIDVSSKRLIIYEGQNDNIFNLRQDLENIIAASIEEDTPEKNTNLIYPIATIALIAINIIVFLFMEFQGSTENTAYMASHGALYWRFLFEDHEYYRLLTSMFMHFGANHLLNNMITLGFIGKEVEKYLGHVKFTIIYMISGLGSGLMSSLYNMNVNHDDIIISAGASGAIFGVLGALLVLALVYRDVRSVIRPANVFIIAVLSIVNGLMSYNIDNAAHIGGFMIGIIITFISCLYTKSVIK